MKNRIMNNSYFKTLIYEKIVWENKELEKRHRLLAKKSLIFLGIPALILIVADQIIGDYGKIGIIGVFAILPGLFFFISWGILQGLELADKITRKQH